MNNGAIKVMEIVTDILDESIRQMVQFMKDNTVTMNSGGEEVFFRCYRRIFIPWNSQLCMGKRR